MTIDAARFQKLLDDFKLEQLFNELGWERPHLKPQAITVNDEAFTLTNVAHKRGVAVFRCSPDRAGRVPTRPLLLKIEKEAVKRAYEHLLVFADAGETMLTWLWVSRAPGQPTTTRSHTWRKGQNGEALRQKLSQIVWSLEEEEAITLTDVITGLRNAFDRDRISKSFYEKFKAQHEAFANFIEGLTAASDKAWYASLMLNRLMFVYFIQKKGFLDGDENYLANRMAQVQAAAGKGKFHSFYRQFLRRLFHEGLGQAKGERNPELSRLIGDVPYLNGGLFDEHELEIKHHDLNVPDEAFERLFAFFDAWDWHLDDRPLASGKEINPDVLGYIFEKYINQKQMGAYYTKEDITGYIAKNTVVPHLIEQARERCKVAFEGEASMWNLLQADPDRYIYPAMKTGVIDAAGTVVPESALPDFVQAGMKDAKARMFERRYNLGEAVFYTATGERGTLPTETWREYVERRSRCLAVRDQLAKGEVKSADALITLNLDICQFMQDVIYNATSPDLLRAVWQAIVGRVPEKANEKFRHGITILDPTCGSGAFLFAALNILEPLYDACLERMEGFIEDARKLGKSGEKDFINVLAEVDKHPSRRYYIFKSIILHNLFGVDIMAEAVEICKLRLFLKLVSQVDVGRELEPLPDIDFNIRAGNTLVGYATEAQFDAANTLASDQSHRDEIKARIADLADLFDRFREQQTVHGGKVTADDKRRLRDKLSGLSLELDKYLSRDYGIDPDAVSPLPPGEGLGVRADFVTWRKSHQPFHWFAEFYGVMREGGFDVVIGNPPYVEISKVSKQYQFFGFETSPCGNLYAPCIERAYQIQHRKSFLGFIVQQPVTSTARMTNCRDRISSDSEIIWVSTYDDRPSKLFDGMHHARLAIVLAKRRTHNDKRETMWVTKYNKWYKDERDILFQRLSYFDVSGIRDLQIYPKMGTATEATLLDKLSNCQDRFGQWMVKAGGEHKIYYKITGVGNWFAITRQPPNFIRNGKDSASTRQNVMLFLSADICNAAFCLLNSTLFYWFYQLRTNCRDFNPSDYKSFPLPRSFSAKIIAEIADKLDQKLKETTSSVSASHSITGAIQYEQLRPKNAKSIIDQIDLRLAQLYGLSDEETDFIINYDIKYRMGGADEEE